eukprot:TRINITY_DN29962_c0_g1_i7.p2 TRINITY_DN29962_c0_g1~~TRINITY_DN29962_c0_g1_i7.p2  ORF type:complete len:115 (+),score=20.00 TRINITY_DN29962_c0_g1_i7:123-467(+)
MSRIGSGAGSLFGAGLYFAESCLKADEYTKSDENDFFPLILCRVTLGVLKYCDTVRIEDVLRQRPELEAAVKPGGGHHAVLGDREKARGTFREFVVFDNHQVYPEYIIWYEREH